MKENLQNKPDDVIRLLVQYPTTGNIDVIDISKDLYTHFRNVEELLGVIGYNLGVIKYQENVGNINYKQVY